MLVNCEVEQGSGILKVCAKLTLSFFSFLDLSTFLVVNTSCPSFVVVDRGVPNPHFPHPLLPIPSPSPPASLTLTPTSLPLEYFSRPHRKKNNKNTHTQKQVISSYNLSFQCMDYYQSPSVHLLVCFGVL